MLTTTDALALADATVDGYIEERRVEPPADPADRRALARALVIRLLNTATALEHVHQRDAERRPRRRRPLLPEFAAREWICSYLDWLQPAEKLGANWLINVAKAARTCSRKETARYRPTLTVTRCTDDFILRAALDQLATDTQLADELITLCPHLVAKLLRVRAAV
ncbi:hypothetical protein GONAM_16_00320 [Gordonia namibiensis NBRC 108229]|uniref:Uncharacterized protein n=1 Tax=Gordonia namibiensis NBRC 108229 TaxID=1208314 RepID=K6X818_9ACTN|nr:hypothetical protein [Gordonia namibiensis]GAC00533.1 hypothetical protein GONAM_16_00320 [Gordonia namibiensis NBRC 108229]